MGAQTTRKSVMSKIILVTGASSGFGRLTAEALAKAGHTVYASMRETTGGNAPEVAKVAAFSQAHGVDLRTIELDVLSQDSVDAAVAKVIADTGHMVFGPAEAFTPEQPAQLYDVSVLSTQRVKRAVLPSRAGISASFDPRARQSREGDESRASGERPVG
jgi:NAD(P)-dependent dehydrogenase (short-subunit alcohol dehydrogenase family)